MSALEISEPTAGMLEWPAFLELFSNFVTSPAAKQAALQIQTVDLPQKELALTAEALSLAKKDQVPGLSFLEDISDLLHQAAIANQLLQGTDLYRIYKLAAINNEIRNRSKGWRNEYLLLHEKASRLPDLKVLEEEIAAKIEPTGEVKEDATPELIRIQRQVLHLKSRIERTLEKFLRDTRYQTVLQEDYVTYRHGRAVLLIRTDQKNQIRGIIHGHSGSGASLFLEPMNVLDLNNELAEVLEDQQTEISRVLRELTASVGRNADILLYSLSCLTSLDLILARGRFGKAFDCIIPELQGNRIVLKQARHPILQTTLQKQGLAMVPFDLEMNPEHKGLIVTGPNTGGKTVFLKTVGLLSLMAHSGFPVPAAEGTILPHLSSIEADIGDQQSITESLSTFSSHISNIRSILTHLRESSLILLDELGTGTDPEEGAALAVAIVQELLQHNVKTIATSHHSQLKIFAFNHPACLTAAMEFDEQRLLPTYRVLIDQVGASHAFDTAERLGLPPSILRNARSFVGETQQQLQEFQRRLRDRIRELTEKQEALEKEKQQWQERARRQEEQLQSLQNKLKQKLKTLREQNIDLVRTLNARVERMMNSIRDAELQQQLRKQYKQEVAPAIEKLYELTPPAESPTEEFRPGERVWVNLYKDFGQIVALKKGQAELIIRNKRFTLPLHTLEKKETAAQSLPEGVQIHIEEKEVPPELNVIGQRVEDALPLVDKYLDDAFLEQLREVRIIHGHGTGRLKRAIEELLQNHPHVRNYHSETQQRGGSGVTVVELKSR